MLIVPGTATPFLGSIQGHLGFGGKPLGRQTTGNGGHMTVVVVAGCVIGKVGNVSVTPGGSVMMGNGAGRL